MNRPMSLLTASVLCLGAALGTGAAGCRSTDDLPPGALPPVQRAAPAPEAHGTGNIGPFGYQRSMIRPGYSGSGSLLSAGLPSQAPPEARGGGPVSHHEEPIRGLAPDEHIGTPHASDGIRVVTDPATDETAPYTTDDPAR